MNNWWKAAAPVAVAVVLALIPPPEGLPQHAWWYFAIFAGVIVGLMLEPLPGGAIGLIAVGARHRAVRVRLLRPRPAREGRL